MIATTASPVTTVTPIATDVELRALQNGWNRLAGDVPFRRFEWLATWWRHYRTPPCQLFVVAVQDADGELLGLAPWYVSRSAREGRILRFLGSGAVCSDYLTVLAADGAQSQVTNQIADWLVQGAGREWDRLELVGIEEGDATVEMLAARLQVHGYDVHWRPGLNCWRLTFPDTWEAYLMSLSKSRRERVRQLQRRAFDTGRAVAKLVESPSELDAAFRQLVELHQKRRSSLGEQGCFESPRFTAFHRDVMRQLFELGLLRVWSTELDGRPAAIEYDVIGGDTVYFYQSGIEPALAADRPGWLGTIGSLRDALERGYRHFDFMRGDEAYKASWGATVRPTVELRVVAPRALARSRYTAWGIGQSLRRLARRGRAAARRFRMMKPVHSGEMQ